jgi:hypothetical protein
MIGKAIYTILSTDPAIAMVVATRIFPAMAVIDGTRPSIVYTEISNTPTMYKQGPSDMDFVRVQVDIYSPSYDQCVSLAELVRIALDRFPHSTVAGVRLAGISFMNSSNSWADGDKIHRIIHEYQIRHNRPLS